MLETNENKKFTKEGITFDDVLLIPGESDCTPDMVDIHTHLTKDIVLNTPIMTSAMDTVTESRMAIAIAREGGIGIIHKNMTIAQQADEVDKVKRSENGVIVDPFSLTADKTVAEADALMGKYKISGVPIVDKDNKLVGILTNRDLRFIKDFDSILIKDVMTKDNLVTAPVGTDLAGAQSILMKHKIEKLPLVDANGVLKGLITIKDIEKAERYPNSARDKKGRLLCGAAIGMTQDVLDRAGALIDAQVDVLVLDSAHGHSMNVINCLKKVKAAFPDTPVIAGNIATAAAAKALCEAGADAIMIHSRKKDPAEIFEFVEKFRAKDPTTPIVVVPTSFNTVTEEEFKERGVNVVIYANQLTRTAFPAMQNAAELILKNHRAKECDDICMPFKDIIRLIPDGE